MINTSHQPRILIVDDDPATGVILEGYLKPDNYEVHFVDNGQKALKAVKSLNQDLILLDIEMPGMSGFELCEALKNDEATRDIPVLFITAHSDSDFHKKAIESGGEGFVVKPVNEGLIRAYAKTFVRMKQIHDNATQRLSLDKEFMCMSIHDLNNLNLAISGNLELAMFERDQSEGANKYVENALSVLARATKMLSKLQDIMRLESSKSSLNYSQINLIDMINEAAELLVAEMELKNLRFVLEQTDFFEVYGDRNLLLRVLLNLIGNAVKFAWSDTEIGIKIRKNKEEEEDSSRWLEVIISNQCLPIPKKCHELIFEKFKQLQKRKSGKGLGLAFCKLTIESHGGRIWLESPLSGQKTGASVHFTLPSGAARAEENRGNRKS